MPSSLNLEPDTLAPVLHAAIERLGELGELGLQALLNYIRDRPAGSDFDAGYDLLYSWLQQPT